MARSFYGACIGFIGGLLLGWILESFVLDQAAIDDFRSVTNTSLVIVLGIAVLAIGFFIMYVTNSKE